MNTAFYLALDRLPMSLVAAMEFAGTVMVALWGLRSGRNFLALALVVAGVGLLVDVRWESDGPGLLFALVNAILFVFYIVLGHRIAESGAAGGVERFGAAMAIAFLFILPVGLVQALRAFSVPELVLAGVGVGVCSSVIPYVTDQLAMSRLPRATFALMLALLPAIATVIGALVLGQIPAAKDMAGIALVMAGVAIHRPGTPGAAETLNDMPEAM
jgi:inner membrane transporter RhtA